MTRRARHVQRVIDALLADSAPGASIHLDRVGDAVGAQAFSADDIEAVIAALESAGRQVVSPSATGKTDLPAVLEAARAIQSESGSRATVAAIAKRTGLTEDAVRLALSLGRVMGR